MRVPRHLAAAAVLCLLAAALPADEAEDAFNSLYGNDYKKATATPDKADDVALAADLLKAAKAQGVQPGLVAILCDKAHELGVRLPTGYETAVEAMELVAQAIPAAAPPALDRVATIREKQYQAAKGLEKADAGEVFIESVLAAAAAHMASGATAEASALLRKALVVANAIKSDRKNEIQGRIDFAATRLRIEKQVADLKAKLVANPQDAAVRKQLVQACLVELDDPAQAEKFLDESSDPLLRKYVPAVSKGVDAAPEIACMELGEWYRGLGEAGGVTPGGKEAMLRRARAYYQRFLNLHTTEDIARNQAALAVKKADEALAKLGPAKGEGIIGPGRWIDLLKLIDLEKDTVEGKGKWKLAEGELLYLGGFPDWSRVSVPCAPAGNYELKVRVACVRGNRYGSAVALLPVGNTAVAACFFYGGDSASLGGIEKPREQRVALTVIDGQEYEFDITVLLARDQADITITSGGKMQLHWQGPQSALRGGDVWHMPDVRLLGLGIESARMAIKCARLKMLTGKAKLLR
jgi:tetratricopeptide (TPR) repeat protein